MPLFYAVIIVIIIQFNALVPCCYYCNFHCTCLSEEELAVQRTCLHPIQELFIWTLYAQHLEMAVVFWERCDVSN